MAANSPNIYCPLALYRAGAQDGRPYGKALRLYEFAGKNTILKACTAREADNSLPYSQLGNQLPVKFRFFAWLRETEKQFYYFSFFHSATASWSQRLFLGFSAWPLTQW